jgi:hypothetical protein
MKGENLKKKIFCDGFEVTEALTVKPEEEEENWNIRGRCGNVQRF